MTTHKLHTSPMKLALTQHLRKLMYERNIGYRKLCVLVDCNEANMKKTLGPQQQNRMSLETIAKCFNALGYELCFHLREIEKSNGASSEKSDESQACVADAHACTVAFEAKSA